MNNIQTYMTNKVAPGAGYTYGTFLNDPGDGTGSEIVVKTHNDFLYALYTPIVKYLGAVSDTDETENASDFTDAIETAIGIQNENNSLWLNGTTYALYDTVMYLGMQYVSLVAGNVGNDPIDTIAKWLPCINRDDAMSKYRNGEIIPGGVEALHDPRDALYLQFYESGKYNYGGSSGRNFQAYNVHLDGTVITGDATLVAIFDVGGADEYPHLDIIAPDIVGTRTLLDASSRVARVTDAAGPAVVVGAVQADQFQGWQAGADNDATGARNYWGAASNRDTVLTSAALATFTDTQWGTGQQGSALMIKAMDDGTNGTPRTGTETRMMNYSIGIPSVLVMLEI